MLLSRRDALCRCAALGLLTAASDVLEAFAIEPNHPTVTADLGPFYRKHSPERSSLRISGDPGLPLKVRGQVFDARGNPLPGARIEIWHTDHAGLYDLKGFRYRAQLVTGADGSYGFESIMPGHYPDRVAQHVHYLVRAPGSKPLVTQLCFATDPAWGGDPAKNYKRDPIIPSAKLIRPVTLSGDPKDIVANVTFDLELERA